MQDDSPLVRLHVAWALGEIGGEKALAGLEARQSIELDPDVAQEIDSALSRLDGLDA